MRIAPRCTICRSPLRDLVDAGLRQGMSFSAIERETIALGHRYDRETISRHCAHVKDWLWIDVGTPPPRLSLVYYAQRRDGDIKIGTSRNLDGRIRTLCGEHGALALLALEPGDRSTEKQRHAQFADYRRYDGAKQTEWFRCAGPLLEHMESLREEHRAISGDCATFPTWRKGVGTGEDVLRLMPWLHAMPKLTLDFGNQLPLADDVVLQPSLWQAPVAEKAPVAKKDPAATSQDSYLAYRREQSRLGMQRLRARRRAERFGAAAA